MGLALNNAFNSLVERYYHGKRVFVKARGGVGQLAHVMANFFFRLGKIPIEFCTDPRVWQRWEVRCYRMLNGRFAVYPISDCKVAQEKLPGKPLWDYMNEGKLTRKMVRAAAREFRRAHSMQTELFDDRLWSHGDATMANVIYDPATDRARLIDFEILHRHDWPAVKRHADDLLVFLFDLVSMSHRKRWLLLALEFLRTYGDPNVIARVQKRLRAPAGLYRIWWHVRTNFVDTHMVMRRLLLLKSAIQQGAIDNSKRAHRRYRNRRIHDRSYDARSLTGTGSLASVRSLDSFR